jgi:hypothetical protein
MQKNIANDKMNKRSPNPKSSSHTNSIEKKNLKLSAINLELMENKQLFSMWQVRNYTMKQTDIDRGIEKYELEEKIELLETVDKFYHDKIEPTKTYKFLALIALPLIQY